MAQSYACDHVNSNPQAPIFIVENFCENLFIGHARAEKVCTFDS